MPSTSVPDSTPEPGGRVSGSLASCLRLDEQQHGSVRVALAGELDIASVSRVGRVLRRAQEDSELVVLDLRELWFMDCSGAHLIVEADRRARLAGGRLVVVRAPARVDWFFGLIGLDHRLELVDEPPTPGPEPEPEPASLRSVAA